MMMTVKETPKETRVSIYNERNSKSAGRIKGKQPGERSPQSISRTKSKVRDIVACNEFDLAVTLEINPRKVPIAKQEDTLQEIIDYQPPTIRARSYDPGRGAAAGQQQVHFVYPWGTPRD